MISASYFFSEAARRQARKCDPLQYVSPDASLDRITRSVAHRFAVPIALISLRGHKQQWHRFGPSLSPPDVDGLTDFCAQVTLAEEVLVVPDLEKDTRFENHPQGTGAPRFRFCAGAPLLTADGSRLGALWIADTSPRSFSSAEAADLEDLAAMITDTLEARRGTAPLVVAVESTALGVIICDPRRPDLPIVFANANFQTLSGYSHEEVLGRNCRFLQGPDTDPSMVAQMREAIAKRQPFSGILRNYRKDGTPFWNALQLNPVPDDTGNLLSWVGIQTDITAQIEASEQALESEARFDAVQQVAQVGSWECAFTAGGEQDFTSLQWSAETYRLFQVASGTKDNLTEIFYDRVHSEDRAKVQAAFTAAVQNHQRYRIDHRLVLPSGIQRVVHEEAEIVVDQVTGQPVRLVGTVQDITERVFAAEVSRHLTEARELSEMLHRCTQSMVDHLGAAFARIWTLNERENVLELCASSGMYTHLNGPHGRIPMGQFKIGKIASERLPHLTNQVLGDPRVPEQAWAREKGLTAFAGYPLIVDDRLVGVMAMFSRHKLSEQILEAMAAVARQVALGIERKTADAALRMSEENHRSLFHTIPLPTCIFDLSTLMFLEVNHAAVKHYGYSREEFLAMDLLRLCLPEDVPTVLEELQASTADHTRVGYRRHRKKDGTVIEIEIYTVVVTFAGQPARLAVFTDLTERLRTEQALRESETRYERIAANVPGMVYRRLLRTDGTIVYPLVSEGCREIFGVEPEQVVRDPELMIERVHPEDRIGLRESILESAKTLQPWQWQGRIVRPDTGDIRYLQAVSRPERQVNGDVIWDGVVMDVTDTKRAEGDRQAKEEAVRANRAKTAFLSRISHELRTPLNAILGFSQVLGLSPLPEQDALALNYIVKGGQHLLALVDEVLDFSRAETGELHLVLREVDPIAIVEECVGLVARLAAARGITCTVNRTGQRAAVWCDEHRLRQMVLNLLSNAIKYNRENGQVTVHFEPLPTHRLRLKISDTGEGISPEDIARLFVPFERLGHEFDETEGTGLGLVVSLRIAQAMGGSVGVESQLGCGSHFWIELPQAPLPSDPLLDHEGEAGSPKTAPGALQQVDLLYIEDNESNSQVMQMILAHHRPHWRFTSIRDGSKGLAHALRSLPNLILLDLHLPGMRGEDVLDGLRSDPATSRIPVVVLSADATLPTRKLVLARGAADYVSKPFEANSMLQVLDAALSKSR